MSDLPVLLVRLFPAEFRLQFARDMREQIRRDAERAREQGRVSSLAFALSTLFDLLRSAIAERSDPTWTKSRLLFPDPENRESMLKAWMNDLKRALQALRREPGFAAVTVLTLGLAIGVNVSIFSVVDAVLLNALPYPDADRLVVIAASAPGPTSPKSSG